MTLFNCTLNKLDFLKLAPQKLLWIDKHCSVFNKVLVWSAFQRLEIFWYFFLSPYVREQACVVLQTKFVPCSLKSINCKNLFSFLISALFQPCNSENAEQSKGILLTLQLVKLLDFYFFSFFFFIIIFIWSDRYSVVMHVSFFIFRSLIGSWKEFILCTLIVHPSYFIVLSGKYSLTLLLYCECCVAKNNMIKIGYEQYNQIPFQWLNWIPPSLSCLQAVSSIFLTGLTNSKKKLKICA